jgi:hypothetical protein
VFADISSLIFIRSVFLSDVLCGRGSAANNHVGNRRFRDFVKRFEDKYHNSCKADKSFIALQIVLHIQTQVSPPGRFLLKLPASEAGPNNEVYYEIDAIKASKKVSQRLREKKIAASAIKDSKNLSEGTVDVEEKPATSAGTCPQSIAQENNGPALVVDEEAEAEHEVMLEPSSTTVDCKPAEEDDLPPAADLIEDVFSDF